MSQETRTVVDERPWGRFEQFAHNVQCTVKIIDVLPGKQLSYQFHRCRDELWKIISGNGFVVIDGVRKNIKAGDELFLPRLTRHRIGSDNEQVKFLEVSFGAFDEQDNVRLEDDYGRS